MKKTILVCDENNLIPALQKEKINICPITHFSPDATPAIINASINKLDRARELWHCIDKPQRAKSLIVVRIQPGEKVPSHQPPGIILLPWCDDQQFAGFFRLLLLRPNLRVYPDWFYSRILQSGNEHHFKRWAHRFSELSEDDIVGMKNSDMMAKKLAYSQSTLLFRCNQLYGCSPGEMRRVLRTFLLTAMCIRYEGEEQRKIRGKGSPLPSTPGDYRRILQREFCISYSELREQSQDEHWAAVLMRTRRDRKLLNGTLSV